MGVGTKWLLSLSCLLTVVGCGHGGKILVFPEDGSHWVNMQVILKELHSRGHVLTVMRSSRSWYIQESSSLYTSITVNPHQGEDVGPDFFKTLLEQSLALRRMPPFLKFIEEQRQVASMLKIFHGGALTLISAILEDSSLMARLKNAKFDIMLTDPAFPAGVLLAQYLHLPMVYNVRWLNAGEAHMAIAPTPPSYVPMYNSLLSDHMDFLERTENFLRNLITLLLEQYVILPIYEELLCRHFPPGCDLLSMQRSADMWLMRVDFVFEFPRPTMPNVVYMGGFQCHPAQPLSEELETFMQSSGEHGVVIMSLGAMVSALPMEITEAIAAAFSKIPQRVVWRYLGERPSTLGNNTLLVKWLPQNDLLGHPKTRAFVAHGGTNGMYEAIYHGVPVLGLPLLFDQHDNMLRMQVRGAARVIDVTTTTAREFLEAINDVLYNSSYRQNIKRLSKLHRDQPLSPLENAIFWIEHVIRHKGVPHLRTESYNLPWYSYHSLDVAALLLTLSGFCVWVPLWACRLLYHKASSRERKVD